MRKLPDIVAGTKPPDRRHQNLGRGQYEADIDFVNDRSQDYYGQFAQACQALDYHEMLALSRALDLSIRTIYRWKNHGPYTHDIYTILLVLNWHKAGKPIIVRSQRDLRASMRPQN